MCWKHAKKRIPSNFLNVVLCVYPWDNDGESGIAMETPVRTQVKFYLTQTILHTKLY